MHPATQAAAFALVNGAPFYNLPDDLYIPSDALEVLLDTFEGPLDLLLYLIRKQNLDIVQIPIATITKQYIAYIDTWTTLNMELAADYLVMAAYLAEIKSKMLLPREHTNEAQEEDPRAELIRQLQEYERIKTASEYLDELPRLERDIFTVNADTSALQVNRIYPDVQLSDLLDVLQDVLKRVEQYSHHRVIKEPLSVRERMSAILDTLRYVDNCLFEQLLLQKEGRHGVVVSFLAILELAKEELIEIIQLEPFGQLRIRNICIVEQ
ncbi:MAG: ScpA family protein [Methylococcaceae bacterium]